MVHKTYQELEKEIVELNNMCIDWTDEDTKSKQKITDLEINVTCLTSNVESKIIRIGKLNEQVELLDFKLDRMWKLYVQACDNIMNQEVKITKLEAKNNE